MADARRMHNDILFSLFVVFVAAQLGGEIAQRLKLPGVVGEIVAGCVIGPSVLGWISIEQIAPGTALDVLAEIGVVLLLFSVGLETRLEDLKKVGVVAFLVGVVGVVVPFLMASAVGARQRLRLGPFDVRRRRVRGDLGRHHRAGAAGTARAATHREPGDSRRGGDRRHARDAAARRRGIAARRWRLQRIAPAAGAGRAIGFIAVIGWVGTRMMRWNSTWLDKPMGPIRR